MMADWHSHDVFVSYAKEDEFWVNDFVRKVQDNGFSVNCEKHCLEKCETKLKTHFDASAVILLIFSKYYIRHGYKWKTFLSLSKMEKLDQSKSCIARVLDSKIIICISIDNSDIPIDFADQVILNWSDKACRKSTWQKLMKYLHAARKKNYAKRALSSFEFMANTLDINGNHVSASTSEVSDFDDCLCSDLAPQRYDDSNFSPDESSIKKISSLNNPSEQSRLSKTSKDIENKMISEKLQNNKGICVSKVNEQMDEMPSYNGNMKKTGEISIINCINDKSLFAESSSNLFDFSWDRKIHAHLISQSFTADEDLTEEDVDSLIFKPEDVETIMLMCPNKEERKKESLHDFTAVRKCQVTSPFTNFTSPHEQMKLLDILQSLRDKLQKKIEVCNSNICKRRYRRMLRRFDGSIMSTVNGQKDMDTLNELPLVKQLLTLDEFDGFRCYCCDTLFHSKRAVDIHMTECAKRLWYDLLK